jgi:Nitroreductase family
LPRETAEALYDASNLWTRYGWYLCELAHLEAVSTSRHNNSWRSAIAPRNYLETLDPLFERRTSRTFAPSPITLGSLDTLLAQALAGVPIGKSSLRVFMASLNVSDLVNGLYEWHDRLEVVGMMPALLSRDAIRDLTVGQFPAGSGAATVWLTRTLETSNPAAYELDIIEMGRIGQRICLTATELGLGVFLTPPYRTVSSTVPWEFTIQYRPSPMHSPLGFLMTESPSEDLASIFIARNWRLCSLDGTNRTAVWDAENEFLAMVDTSIVEKITPEDAAQAKTLQTLIWSFQG